MRRAFLLVVLLPLLFVGIAPVRAEPVTENRIVRTSTYTLRSFKWKRNQIRVTRFTGGHWVMRQRMANANFGGVAYPSRIAAHEGAQVAVNGDFIIPGTHAPKHLLVSRGEIYTTGIGTSWVLSSNRDGSEAWVGRTNYSISAHQDGNHFPIKAWNAGQATHSRTVAFTGRGLPTFYPRGNGCSAFLKPVRGSLEERTYRVVQVRHNCSSTPLRATGDVHNVVLVGQDVRRLDKGRVTIDASFGHQGVWDASGGTPQIVDNGQNVGPQCSGRYVARGSGCGTDHGPDAPFFARNPRTVIGITEGCSDNEERTACNYLMVSVDGRQPGWSIGMRFPLLGHLLVRLGAYDAINLDGGGSTETWTRKRSRLCIHNTNVGCIVSRPSYGERNVISIVGMIRA